MPQYTAFLRAINVTGRFVKMAVLAEHGRALGLTDVQTHNNSGDLISSAPARQAATLAARIEAGLAPLLGDDFVCTTHEVLWLCRTRQSDSRISNAVLERTLRLRCTLRRASMLQGLIERLQAGGP